MAAIVVASRGGASLPLLLLVACAALAGAAMTEHEERLWDMLYPDRIPAARLQSPQAKLAEEASDMRFRQAFGSSVAPTSHSVPGGSFGSLPTSGSSASSASSSGSFSASSLGSRSRRGGASSHSGSHSHGDKQHHLQFIAARGVVSMHSTPAVAGGEDSEEFSAERLSTVNRECPQKVCKREDACPFDGGVCCNGAEFCCPAGHTCLTTSPPTCVKDSYNDENRCAEEECLDGYHCPHNGVSTCCLGGTVCCPDGTQCRATTPVTCEKVLNPMQAKAREQAEIERRKAAAAAVEQGVKAKMEENTKEMNRLESEASGQWNGAVKAAEEKLKKAQHENSQAVEAKFEKEIKALQNKAKEGQLKQEEFTKADQVRARQNKEAADKAHAVVQEQLKKSNLGHEEQAKVQARQDAAEVQQKAAQRQNLANDFAAEQRQKQEQHEKQVRQQTVATWCNDHQDVDANAFNAWHQCPGDKFMIGMYRNGIDDLRGLTTIRCASACGVNGQVLPRSNCIGSSNFWATFDHGQRSTCPDNYYLAGMYKGGCVWIYCIENILCCRMGQSTRTAGCSEQGRMSSSFDREGWFLATDANGVSGQWFLSGFRRSGDIGWGWPSNQLHNIEEPWMCHPYAYQ